jgi:2-methylcitrate dehydratase PrpD
LHTKISPLTQSYADFITDSAGWTLDADVQDVAVLGFTDAIGVMLAGAREGAVQTLTRWALTQGGHAQSRVVSCAQRLPAAQAALINATAAHALDYDDFAFSNHPSAVLVPAILAAADAHPQPVSGATMVRAYAVGYEVWADIFLREKDLYYDKGWHPTAVLGTLGSAAAAAVVWGLSCEQARHALALAASNAGGIFENFGTMAKPYHGGRAASVGLTAAGMAACGLAASATAVEGRHGLLRAFSPQGQVDLSTPMHRGQAWRISARRLNIKKYPVVGAAQRCIDAVLALNQQTRVQPGQVSKIVAHVSERHAAVMPYHLPQDALQAKFSLQFAVASALVHNAVGFAQLQDSVVQEPELQALMARIELHTTDAFEADWRDAAPFDQVFVHLSDGTLLATPQVRRATGHADTPLPAQQLQAKFMGCVQHAGIDAAAGLALYARLQQLPWLHGAADIALPILT